MCLALPQGCTKGNKTDEEFNVSIRRCLIAFFDGYLPACASINWRVPSSQGPHFRKSLPMVSIYSITFGAAATGFRTWLCHLLTPCPQIKHLPLWFSFLIYKMDKIVLVLHTISKIKSIFWTIKVFKKIHSIVTAAAVVVNDISTSTELNYSYRPSVCLHEQRGANQWLKTLMQNSKRQNYQVLHEHKPTHLDLFFLQWYLTSWWQKLIFLVGFRYYLYITQSDTSFMVQSEKQDH